MNRKVIISIIITAILVTSAMYIWSMMSVKKVEVDIEYEYFPIYSSDEEAMDVEVNFYTKIPQNIPVIDKLKILADKLSRFIFKLPIEVIRIEEREGKKIAVINLLECDYDEENTKLSWSSVYFQGSTGGYFTTISIHKTFLQEDYKGEWIDGIEFHYKGVPILENDWDHISLSGTIFRKKNRGMN